MEKGKGDSALLGVYSSLHQGDNTELSVAVRLMCDIACESQYGAQHMAN